MKQFKSSSCLFVVIILLLVLPSSEIKASVATDVPGIDAEITIDNIQKILKKYDPDGAYIIQKSLDKGNQEGILYWFSQRPRIIDSINLAIHEETHGYSGYYAKNATEVYIIGKSQKVYVNYTKVYNTKEIARSIPKRLRTQRYNTYVAKPVQNLASNIFGAYGLLNEFMAYHAGMRVSVALFPYCKEQKADWEAWTEVIGGCENGKLAYGEFKYYILHYLYYAKKNHPDVYKGIIKNKEFCKAYRKLECSYTKLINEYSKELEKLPETFEMEGKRLVVSDNAVIYWYEEEVGEGPGRFTSDYNNLMNELEKSKYKSIHKKLVKNGK